MVKLNLGSGRRVMLGYTPIDGGDYPGVEHHDITKLPYQDNSVNEIYACHVLEYASRAEAVQWLKEWKRVLEPNGLLRIAVPDFDALFDVYLKKGATLDNILGPLYGQMIMGKEKIYHRTVYNYPSLVVMLAKLGFRAIEEYEWRDTPFAKTDDHSKSYFPHSQEHIENQNWDSTFTLLSLNIKCRK